MMQKVILVAAIALSLASGASAAIWRQCESSNITIINVDLDFCNPYYSNAILCGVEIFSVHNVKVDYIQPKPNPRPWFKWGYTDFFTNESLGYHTSCIGPGPHCEFGIECPGEAGQEQHFEAAVNFTLFNSPGPRKYTWRLIIEDGSDDQFDYLCVEIPLRIFGEESHELI